MDIKKTANAWRPEIEEVIDSKLDEFKRLGYPKATKAGIWECLCKHVWKENPELALHQVVADIFYMKPGTYMNYMARSAYQNDDLLASIQALTGNQPQGESRQAETEKAGGSDK